MGGRPSPGSPRVPGAGRPLPAKREEEPRPCVGPSTAKALPERSPRKVSQKGLPGSPAFLTQAPSCLPRSGAGALPAPLQEEPLFPDPGSPGAARRSPCSGVYAGIRAEWIGDGSPRRPGFVLLAEEESSSFYSSLTLNYGEEEELSSAPVHVIHTRFILNAVVKGANIAMLAVSICSAFSVLAMAYLGCRSLPCCSCYDSVTGMEWLQPNEDQNQSVEMICAVESPGGRIFNFTDRFPAQDVDAEEDTSKPPPFIRMT
ncbi:uncharacterized protein LOC135298710 isoform X2 [Passer domesticus]|uniref:uncharacterized protein LOC135298710 isoform X2 n=1 Tax=Passer domesticus TaxID=48849 RepID=UPI0030FEE939